MRLAILSDIHANMPAFEAVLQAVDDAGVEQAWCLGDVVGYGAHPDECASAVAEHCDVSLVGNHDLAVTGDLDISSFSPAASAAVRWTQRHADDETMRFLRGLEPAATDAEVALYHASPRDPVWEYVLWPDQAAECLAHQARRVSFIGHSHVALFFTVPGDGDGPAGEAEATRLARGAQAEAGLELDLAADRWLINPGSVGQPRDGDPRAAWLELDTDAWKATYRRVDYDIERASEAILRADLPEHLAKRLHIGQ
jgi:predicted phosphodiesterase